MNGGSVGSTGLATVKYIECDITPPTSSPYTTPITHIVSKRFALASVVGHWLRPFYVMYECFYCVRTGLTEEHKKKAICYVLCFSVVKLGL